MALLAGALALFLAAGLGIFFMSVQTLRQAGMAMNPSRPLDQRRGRALLAALCCVGVVACATLGYLGIVALMYYAQQEP